MPARPDDAGIFGVQLALEYSAGVALGVSISEAGAPDSGMRIVSKAIRVSGHEIFTPTPLNQSGFIQSLEHVGHVIRRWGAIRCIGGIAEISDSRTLARNGSGSSR